MLKYLRRYYLTLRKYRTLVVVITLISVLGAFIKTMRTPDMYRASTTMELVYRSPAVVPTMQSGTLRSPYWSYDEFANTQIRIIHSSAIGRRVIESMGLKGWSPADVAGRIQILQIPQSHLIVISAIGTNPDRVAMLANATAQAFQDFQFEKQVRTSKKIIQWLRNRIEEVLEDLRKSRQAEYEFAREKKIVSLEGHRSVLNERLEKLQIAYSDTRTKRLRLEAVYDQLKKIKALGNAGYDKLSSVITGKYSGYAETIQLDLAKAAVAISEAATTYGPKHPKMVRLMASYRMMQKNLRDLVDKYVESAHIDWNEMLAQERALKTELSSLTDETQAFNKTWMAYLGLQQDVEKSQQLYDILIQRLKEIDITKNLQSETSHVVEAAEPPAAPFAPNIKLNLLAALLLGLGIGVGLAFLADYYDPRVRYAEEFSNLTKIPVLVEIPIIGQDIADPMERNRYIQRITQLEPASHEAEIYRVLRTHLLFGGENNKAIRTLIISGVHPKEGKSTVATNLAISMAAMERRVLLVDADIRRASLTHSFEFEDMPGLSETISGEEEWQSVIQSTEIANLFMVPAGAMQVNPGELLTSKSLRRLINNWKTQFDTIIIDMAPVLAVSDTLSLAADVESLLLVVKPGSATKNEVLATVDRLKRMQANVIGAVFNQVDAPEAPASGYYYYYRRGGHETEL